MAQNLRHFCIMVWSCGFFMAHSQTLVLPKCECLLGGPLFSTAHSPKQVADIFIPLYSTSPVVADTARVLSCASGVVQRVLPLNDAVLMIVKKDTLAYLYIGDYEPLLSEGMIVERGTPLGQVTKSSPLPRVYFSVAQNGNYLAEAEIIEWMCIH